MKEIRIDSTNDFFDIIQGYNGSYDIYRGVTKSSYDLKPKVGRDDFIPRRDLITEEKHMLNLFKERSIPYLEFHPETEWEWLAVAQHFGLPTRLLDWSRNPLVAAFFAVEKSNTEDSAIYVLRGEKLTNTIKHPKPFEYNKVGKYVPRHISRRIIAQKGIFTIHPTPNIPFDIDKIDKLIISHSIRKTLKNLLNTCGINESILFPGLDGLTTHIKWLRTNSH